jgi:c-di-GMP-related signal transduction protein
LSRGTRAALCGTLNKPRMLLDCVIAYERADWDVCERLATALRLDPDKLPRAYRESLEWTLGLEGSAA